jgi:hypothetical protein
MTAIVSFPEKVSIFAGRFRPEKASKLTIVKKTRSNIEKIKINLVIFRKIKSKALILNPELMHEKAKSDSI